MGAGGYKVQFLRQLKIALRVSIVGNANLSMAWHPCVQPNVSMEHLDAEYATTCGGLHGAGYMAPI